MTVEISTPRSRRAILGAGLGAVVATVATALGRPLAVRATEGEPVLVGNIYTATTVTGFDTTGGATALSGASDSNIGVYGGSTSYIGVQGFSQSFTGVFGDSSSGYGVYGSSDASDRPAILGKSHGGNTGVQGFSGLNVPAAPAKTGVYGYADQDIDSRGVTGQSKAGYGVHGIATTGQGVNGSATSGYGVYGLSDSGWGVFGNSASGDGVVGSSDSGYGVVGSSSASDKPAILGTSYGGNTGVHGLSAGSNKAAILGVSQGDSTGVQGFSGSTATPTPPAKTGVYGYAAQDATSVGVRGTSTIGTGVVGKTASGTGVTGTSTSGVGIRGTGGTGRGGVFSGNLAQLRLSPSSAASHPSSGALGDLFLDKSGRLWFCKGGTTWKQIA